MKKSILLCIVIFILASVSACFAEITVTNGGIALSIPDEYAPQLVVNTDENGMLFSVYEKASLEAMKAKGENWPGAGWIFGLGRVSEDEMHEMRCNDIPGRRIFAKDSVGNYYILYRPTDVRMIREDYSDPEGLKTWGDLNQWSVSVPETLIAENESLSPVKYSDTMLDAYLARLLYKDDTKYTVSTLQYGPQEPNGIKAADYLSVFDGKVTFEVLYDGEIPDGEYVVLSFPEDDVRFDFFFLPENESYIRQVWADGKYEMLYKANFEDKSVKAAEVMDDFYHEIVLNNTLGHTPDDMIGTWAEKVAGRCAIEITKAAEEGKYDVLISWSGSAWQKSAWSMTAEATGKGAELRYENAENVLLTWSSEDSMTEERVYSDGTGTFDLLSTNELVWNDEKDHAADNLVFVFAGK